jgi:hypothetical protein
MVGQLLYVSDFTSQRHADIIGIEKVIDHVFLALDHNIVNLGVVTS